MLISLSQAIEPVETPVHCDCQCDVRPTVTFPAAEHHRLLAGTKLYCLVTEAHVCEQLAQGIYVKRSGRHSNLRPIQCPDKIIKILRNWYQISLLQSFSLQVFAFLFRLMFHSNSCGMFQTASSWSLVGGWVRVLAVQSLCSLSFRRCIMHAVDRLTA